MSSLSDDEDACTQSIDRRCLENLLSSRFEEEAWTEVLSSCFIKDRDRGLGLVEGAFDRSCKQNSRKADRLKKNRFISRR